MEQTRFLTDPANTLLSLTHEAHKAAEDFAARTKEFPKLFPKGLVGAFDLHFDLDESTDEVFIFSWTYSVCGCCSDEYGELKLPTSYIWGNAEERNLYVGSELERIHLEQEAKEAKEQERVRARADKKAEDEIKKLRELAKKYPNQV